MLQVPLPDTEEEDSGESVYSHAPPPARSAEERQEHFLKMCISMDEVEICGSALSSVSHMPNVSHDRTVNPDEEGVIGGNRAAQLASGISRCSDIGAS